MSFNSKILFLVTILLLFSVTSASAALPPGKRAKINEENCKETGGKWLSWVPDNGACFCPAKTTNLWNICWMVSPKEACIGLGGEPGEKGEGYLGGGPSGRFKCTRNSENITRLAHKYKRRYSKDIENSDEVREQIERELPENLPWRFNRNYVIATVILVIILIVFYRKLYQQKQSEKTDVHGK